MILMRMQQRLPDQRALLKVSSALSFLNDLTPEKWMTYPIIIIQHAKSIIKKTLNDSHHRMHNSAIYIYISISNERTFKG